MKALSALAAFEVPVRLMDFGTLKVRVVVGRPKGQSVVPAPPAPIAVGAWDGAGDVARDDQDRRGGKEQG